MLPLLALCLSVFLLTAPPAKPPAKPIPTAAPTIDARAEALLVANENAMMALKSYSARCDIVYLYPPTDVRPAGRRDEVSTLTAAKPNLMRFDHWVFRKDEQAPNSPPVKSLVYVYTSDGTRRVQQSGNTYTEDHRVAPENLVTVEEPWTGFYSKSQSPACLVARYKKGKMLRSLRYVGQAPVDDITCDVVAYRYSFKVEKEMVIHDCKLFLGPDKLVRKKTELITLGSNGSYSREDTLRDLKTNFDAPPASTFAYVAPPDVKPFDPSLVVRPKLLTAGTVAPDFTVEDINGKPVKLSDFRGKTVILDFWATWCIPCVASMPSTNAVSKKYKEKVVVLAVNVWDEKPAYQKWVPKYATKYDNMQFLLDPPGRVGDVQPIS